MVHVQVLVLVAVDGPVPANKHLVNYRIFRRRNCQKTPKKLLKNT